MTLTVRCLADLWMLFGRKPPDRKKETPAGRLALGTSDHQSSGGRNAK
jgi:hypothetical protein